MILIWLAAMVVFAIAEAATVGLVACWFALGSLAALISAALNAPLWLQIVWFLVVSAVTLGFTRPIAAKYVNSIKRPTNADRVLEMVGVVTETIDNVKAAGTVRIDGKLWTARSLSGEVIEEGSMVHPVMIEGVKLIVEPVSAHTAASHPE